MTPTQMILEATLHQKRITALLHRLLQVQVRAQLDFVPSQIPSYTTQNYQSSSSSSTSVPPPQFNRPPPNSAKYPPPPAPVSGLPGGPLGSQGNLNLPPPPPPVNYGKSAHEDPLPSSAVS